jgi:ketosteroid isomerase-like protein
MSNADLLREVYAEWERGNWQPKFDIYDEQMVWGWSEEFPGLGGVYRDPAERNKRVAEWLSGWEDWRCEAEEFIEDGDTVVALCNYAGRGKGSGVRVDTKGAHLWRLRDGKVVYLEIFATRERALAAAGLTA